MVVKKTVQTQESKEQEAEQVEDRKMKALNAILPTLDFPTEEQEENEEVDELEELRAQEEKDKRENQKKGHDKAVKKYNDEEEEEEEEQEEEDEDQLIPKSKVDKRFKALTAKIKQLEAEHATAAQPAAVTDPDMAKLNNMTPEQLKQTLRDVRTKSIILAASSEEGDKAQVQDYVDLEMKIHDSMASYNSRFYNDQVKEMNNVIASVEYDEDIEDVETAQVEIKKIAEGIYQKYPKMQQLKTGMKQAYQLAIDHYKILQDKGIDKDETKRVKRKMAKIQRKTTLDTSKVKGSKNTSKKLDLLRKRLADPRGATDTDRSDFVKESPLFNIDQLLPEEFKS